MYLLFTELCCYISLVKYRFFEAFRTSDYSDIDSNLQHEAFDWFHRMRTSWIACDLWYDVSCGNYLEYWECPGNMMLNWKDKGYRTVFDLLQVSFIRN